MYCVFLQGCRTLLTVTEGDMRSHKLNLAIVINPNRSWSYSGNTFPNWKIRIQNLGALEGTPINSLLRKSETRIWCFLSVRMAR